MVVVNFVRKRNAEHFCPVLDRHAKNTSGLDSIEQDEVWLIEIRHTGHSCHVIIILVEKSAVVILVVVEFLCQLSHLVLLKLKQPKASKKESCSAVSFFERHSGNNFTNLNVDAKNGFLFHHVPEADVGFELVKDSYEVPDQLKVTNLLHRHMIQDVIAAILAGLTQIQDAQSRSAVSDSQHAVLFRHLKCESVFLLSWASIGNRTIRACSWNNWPLNGKIWIGIHLFWIISTSHCDHSNVSDLLSFEAKNLCSWCTNKRHPCFHFFVMLLFCSRIDS